MEQVSELLVEQQPLGEEQVSEKPTRWRIDNVPDDICFYILWFLPIWVILNKITILSKRYCSLVDHRFKGLPPTGEVLNIRRYRNGSYYPITRCFFTYIRKQMAPNFFKNSKNPITKHILDTGNMRRLVRLFFYNKLSYGWVKILVAPQMNYAIVQDWRTLFFGIRASLESDKNFRVMSKV